ncbi:MAG: acetate--CoA ligase family protein [Patescibacteria group bacterium]|jgi:acetyltransferase
MAKPGNSRNSLDGFFRPRVIAVVGVSNESKKLGTQIYRNLLAGRWHGRVVPVNPNANKIGTVRCYPSVDRIPGRVDLAVIVTPAPTVATILTSCGKKRIKNCVIISAGFRETGVEGKIREQELINIARRYGIKLLGPNCLGFMHAGSGINATFARPIEQVGSLALISQSGALAVAVTDWARRSSVGFRAVISLGNKAGLNENDLIDYFAADPGTSAILLYLESIEHGEKFMATVRAAVKRKPVVIIKSGESELGQRAAISHTGALSSPREVVAAALRQAGAIQIHSVKELYQFAQVGAVSSELQGNNIAIVTNAGGAGIMATDAIATSNLKLSQADSTTIKKLRAGLPAAASVSNPFDLVGDADAVRYKLALKVIGSDPAVSAVVVLLTPQVVTQPLATAQAIIAVAKRYPLKLWVASFLGGESVASARTALAKAGIPHFEYPEEAISAIDMLWRARTNGQYHAPKIQSAVSKKPLKQTGLILPKPALGILKSYGFNTIPTRFAKDNHEAKAAAKSLRYPLVLKISSQSMIHKAAGGGVWVGIKNEHELLRTLRIAERRFPAKYRRGIGEGWLLQHQIHSGVELFLGGRRDSSFGPMVLLGKGGVDVEKNKAITIAFPPFTSESLRRQLSLGSAGRDLMQFIHEQHLDLMAYLTAASHLGQLLREHNEISEVDVNPLFVGPVGEGTKAVDARIIIGEYKK